MCKETLQNYGGGGEIDKNINKNYNFFGKLKNINTHAFLKKVTLICMNSY